MNPSALVAVPVGLAASSAFAEEPRLCETSDHVWGRAIASRDIALPPVGDLSQAEVGQSMITASRAEVMRARVQVTEEFDGKTRLLGIGATVRIPPGPLRLEGINSTGGTVFLAPAGSLKYSTEPRARKTIEVGVVFPPDQDDFPQAFFRSPDGGLLSKTLLADELKYETAKCLRLGQTGFRRELVYGGISQGTISISYREFSGDLARPAFTQELKYDLKEGREIGYKGSRFEIIEATNVDVKFRVVRPLTTP